MSVFFFVIAIGVLVTVHEFGHFWVARRLGVKVLRFSIGFGKPLLSWHRRNDETEYMIAAVPLGGYVQMLDEREGPVSEEEMPRAFNRKPLASRFAVVFAGPLFNFLFAVFAYWLVFMLGVSGMKPVIGEVSPDSLAARGGFQNGDIVRSIDGEETPTWNDVFLQILDSSMSDQTVPVRVLDSDGSPQLRRLDFRGKVAQLDREHLMDAIGIVPYRPVLPAVIDRLEPGGAAEQAGLLHGDRIAAVDGITISSWEQWVAYVQGHPGQTMQVTVIRDGVEQALSLTPRQEGDIGRIGASVDVPEGLADDLNTTVRFTPWAAVPEALDKTWSMSLLTLRMLGKMVTGTVSASSISGPISIAQFAGYSASIGFVAFMAYLALISISLGVLNLLPVPVLDGGHLMYYVVELIKGSPVSEQAQVIGQRIGIMVLVAVMVLAFYNDLVRIFG